LRRGRTEEPASQIDGGASYFEPCDGSAQRGAAII
jgi:hypothetical protein